MVSSELVVLLIVCVGINTGSAQESCQARTNIICGFNSNFDTNPTQCVFTTFNCTNNDCTAEINTVSRGFCQFMNIGANVSLPIHCCMCYLDTNIQENLRWDCNITTSSSLSLLPSATALSTATTIVPSFVTPSPTTTPSTPTSAISAVVVVAPVVVLVVCLLVVCVIATIIILYYRAKHHQQQTTKPTQLDNMAGIKDKESTLICDNSELYNRTTHINTPSCNTVPSPGEYSEITDKEQLAGYSAIDDTNKMTNDEIPDFNYSVIDERKDASEGLVYSAVVSQNGKKTTVKTTAVLDDSQPQQSVSDNCIEGLVYSAVVVQDGKKTTIKTTVFKD